MSGHSQRTSQTLLRTIAKPSVPWSYTAHLKQQYIARKTEALGTHTQPYEGLPLPSEVPPAPKVELPKFMLLQVNRPNATAVPLFLQGFVPNLNTSAAPIEPRKAPEEAVEVEETAVASPPGNTVAGTGKQKGKPLPFHKGGGPGKRVMPLIQSKSLLQLQHQRLTSSSVHDVMASDETPLPARGYDEMVEDKRVRAGAVVSNW